jgi:hypothetical protein
MIRLAFLVVFCHTSNGCDEAGAGWVKAHCKKKVSDFLVPSRDVTNQTLPGKEQIIPGQGDFV